jgi:hypothetical protein
MTNMSDEYRVLYYPDFAPDSGWLRRILLLSDGVVRIVPADVDPDDSDDLKRLQETIEGCLRSVEPNTDDVAIEDGDEARLARAFGVLGKNAKDTAGRIEVSISLDGRLSIADHVFVHESKLSDFVQQELRRNGLLLGPLGSLASKGFRIVQQDASNVILAGLASRIARRLGLDAITEKQMPFAFAALRGVPGRVRDNGEAEGALLGAIASIMIPTSVVTIPPRQYREIRDSYTGLREAFKALTSELAALNRLTRLNDASEFAARVASVARSFDQEYRAYRKSRYARGFKSWAPLCIGGVLSVVATSVSPAYAPELAAASVGIQIIEKYLGQAYDTQHRRVFNMLSGVRRDIIRRSGIRELV